MKGKSYMMKASDVADVLSVSKESAYKIIRKCNEELAAEGYITITGKVPRAYLEKKFYGGL